MKDKTIKQLSDAINAGYDGNTKGEALEISPYFSFTKKDTAFIIDSTLFSYWFGLKQQGLDKEASSLLKNNQNKIVKLINIKG